LPFGGIEFQDVHFEVGNPTAVAKPDGHESKRVGGAHTHRADAIDYVKIELFYLVCGEFIDKP
jgi:hypothetical protein